MGLTLFHVSAIHKTASSTFIDFENLLIYWKLLEFAATEVNRSFLFSTLKFFIMLIKQLQNWSDVQLKKCYCHVLQVLNFWVSQTVIHYH